MKELSKVMLSEKICADRIYLQKHDLNLAQKMFSYIDQDRKRLNEFLPWVKYSNSVQDQVNYIKLTHENWNNFSGFDYGIFEKKTYEYLGNIGVHTIRWDYHSAELGYWILGQFEGKGFISEAVIALEKELFHVGFNRVQIKCSDKNTRSSNVPLRCGYQYEGCLRSDVIEMESFRNTKVFSKLFSETNYPR